MYQDGESVFYYITVMNENYAMPAMPEGVEDGILKGMYRFSQSQMQQGHEAAGAIVRQRRDSAGGDQGAGVLAGEIRRRRRCVERDELQGAVQGRHRHRAVEHAASGGEAARSVCTQQLEKTEGVLVAASDYIKSLPLSVAKWFPRPLHVARYGRLRAQ